MTSNSKIKTRIPLGFRLGLTLAYAPAAIGVILLPVMIGALAAHGVPSNILGFLGFLEFGGMAVGAGVCSIVVKRLGALPICAVGACLMLGGNLLSAFSVGDFHMLFAGRAIAGIGGGLVASSAAAEVARAGLGASMVGLMLSVGMLLACGGYLIGPYLVDIANGRGVFFLSAGFGAIVLMAVFIIAKYAPRQMADDRRDLHGEGPVPEVGGQGGLTVIALAPIAFFSYSMGEVTLWTFLMPLGESYGLSISGISHLVVILMLGTCLPPLLAGWIENKVGLGKTITICATLLVICNLMLVLRFWPWAFAVFLAIRVTNTALMNTLLLAFFAKADSSGRAVAAASGAQYCATAVAPLAAGYFVDLNRGNYFPLGSLSSALFVAALLLVLLLLRLSSAGRARERIAA